MKHYDVIIVGCGPAGVAAAKELKKSNISFCVIDKNEFPREKLCGGGLTHKSIELLRRLDLSIKNIDTISVKEVDLVANNTSKTVPLDNEMIMTKRSEFDYSNLKQVIDKELHEKEAIKDIKDNVLITNKNKYTFKYIIFADGVNGYSRKLISDRKIGFTVEYMSKTKTDKTIVDFDIIEHGYGWIFPKDGHTTIGLGNDNPKKSNYIDKLCQFGNKFGIEVNKKEIRGYPIPIYERKIYKQSVIDNKYILVGDAAALVDPGSGEGIYYALWSGTEAAKSIINCKNNNLKKTYFKNTRKLYWALNKRKIISRLLYSKVGHFCIKVTLKSKLLTKRIIKVFG